MEEKRQEKIHRYEKPNRKKQKMQLKKVRSHGRETVRVQITNLIKAVQNHLVYSECLEYEEGIENLLFLHNSRCIKT